MERSIPQLRRLLTLLRDSGVSHFKCSEFEVTFGRLEIRPATLPSKAKADPDSVYTPQPPRQSLEELARAQRDAERRRELGE